MMEMGMDLVSDIPLTIDNEKIDEDPPSPKFLPLAGHSRFYIVRASQWSPNQQKKLSSEPRKAAAKQMTRRNKIFISCFSDAQTGRHLKGKINGNWKAWVTSFNQKQNAFGGTRSPAILSTKL